MRRSRHNHSATFKEESLGDNVFSENRLPSISIIMAVYQGENYLHKCINSVLDQEFVNFEFIIIDDTSTDATPSVIKSYNDPRIIYIRNNTNIGQTRSLNIGLGYAKAPLIARIDADDSWHPSKLELQMKFLEMHEKITVLGTFANRLNTKGLITGRRTYPLTESDNCFNASEQVLLKCFSVVWHLSKFKSSM